MKTAAFSALCVIAVAATAAAAHSGPAFAVRGASTVTPVVGGKWPQGYVRAANLVADLEDGSLDLRADKTIFLSDVHYTIQTAYTNLPLRDAPWGIDCVPHSYSRPIFFSEKKTVEEDKMYTIALTGSKDAVEETWIVDDNSAVPGVNMTRGRFFNGIPGSSVQICNEDKKCIGLGYKEVTEYWVVPAGVTIDLWISGSGFELQSHIHGNAGDTYTLFLTGTPGVKEGPTAVQAWQWQSNVPYDH